MKNIERRNYDSEIRLETREDKNFVEGHAAVFNQLSEDLGGFREKIEPGAFDEVLQDDVRALFNHDSNMILGRTKSGTLSLSVDENGLVYRYDSPDISYANDLLISMKRGDVNQSSFGFIVEKDEWEKENGQVIRTITKFKRLFDVSPVTYPAYPQTDVAKRALDEWEKNNEKEFKGRQAYYKNKLKLNEKLLKNGDY